MTEQNGPSHSEEARQRIALQSAVDEARRDADVPGLAVGILQGDRKLTAVSGVANAETGRPVSASTLFQVGSISKTFTSAMVMMLVGEGLVSLDDPVSVHLPELAVSAPGLCLDETTITHLLSHTAGFDGDHLLTRREGHDLGALADASRLFAPGQGWSYSNAGFTLAGAVIEAVTGLHFRVATARGLLGPLGLAGAGYRADDVVTFDVAAPHWVHDGTPHVIRGAGWQPGWELEPLDHAPGGLIASIDHLVTWCGFNLDGRDASGAEVLDAAQLDRLHTPIVQAHRGVGIGLDWFVEVIDGATVIGHGGVTAGYVSDLVIVPEKSLGIVVATNATHGAGPARRIRRWALEHFAGLVERDAEPSRDAAPPPEAVCGRYRHAFGILTVSPGVDDGTIVISTEPRGELTWQPPADPPITCGFVAPDEIVGLGLAAQSTGTFGWDPGSEAPRSPSRRADWLVWHERLAPRID